MQLSILKPGQIRTIQRINGTEEVKRRIHDLGLIEGNDVQVLTSFNQNYVILVKGSKLALSKEIATKIIVY